MYKFGLAYPFRSYVNVDPFEVNESNHVIRIDGAIKAQMGTGARLVSIKIENDIITLSFTLEYAGAPSEWAIGTVIHLIYYGAKIEPNPINTAQDILENVDDIHGFNIFELSKEDKVRGYALGVELSTDEGLWDIFYSHGEVKTETPKQLF